LPGASVTRTPPDVGKAIPSGPTPTVDGKLVAKVERLNPAVEPLAVSVRALAAFPLIPDAIVKIASREKVFKP
jgi:hypothetical protein